VVGLSLTAARRIAAKSKAPEMTAFDPADRLRQHAQGLVGRPLSSAELLDVMRLLRLVLEKEKLRGSFPHAALYCDWLLHNEIDRHEIAIKILSKMHAGIADWDRTHDLTPVNRALGLAQLRAEMQVTFAKHKIPTDLLDSFSNWYSFLNVLLQDLSQRPLKLPKKPKGKTKKKLDSTVAEMMSASKKMGSNHWARAFFITCEPHGQNRSFFWNLECEKPDLIGTDHFNVKSELRMTEQPSAFPRP
jgi:hypothetical protein